MKKKAVKKKKAVTVKDKLPKIAQLLGYLGVIPFIALALTLVLDSSFSILGATDNTGILLGYAAIVISFIGAVHWGVALAGSSKNKTSLYVYGVVPSLVAWSALFLPEVAALAGMAVVVIVLYFMDRALLSGLVPAGYFKMRLFLTLIVSLSLLVAALGQYGLSRGIEAVAS